MRPVARRLEESLARFASHCDRNRVALTGGVAVEYHLAAAGRPALRTRIADLDVVARAVEEISPAVTRDFLVSHYHRPGPGVARAMLQLVDVPARLRIDVFPDAENAIASARFASFGRIDMLVLSPAAILAHKLQTIGKASPVEPVDPKHLRDAQALAALLGLTFEASTPFYAPARYCTDLDARCERCERSRTSDFPLAPKREIFALLGYV